METILTLMFVFNIITLFFFIYIFNKSKEINEEIVKNKGSLDSVIDVLSNTVIKHLQNSMIKQKEDVCNINSRLNEIENKIILTRSLIIKNNKNV